MEFRFCFYKCMNIYILWIKKDNIRFERDQKFFLDHHVVT